MTEEVNPKAYPLAEQVENLILLIERNLRVISSNPSCKDDNAAPHLQR